MKQAPDIQKMQDDFKALQEWAVEKIRYYTREHKPPYSQAAFAKEIGVTSKTVLFGLEQSDNMSYKKWMELAQGIIKMERGL